MAPLHRPPTSRALSSRTPSNILPSVVALSFLALTFLVCYKVDDFAAQTKTVAGHNLDPTPWHLFPPKIFSEDTRHARTVKIIHCSYLACRYANNTATRLPLHSAVSTHQCPELFRWIHHDLDPWARSRISMKHLDESMKFAAFRVVIVEGRLYVDMYYACVQSRAIFTIWGLVQLLRRFPGMVPDVDMMFDCMDRPTINRTENKDMPLPLFRYCTTDAHFDIPFPDWSFWGWPEVNIRSWGEEFKDIKKSSKSSNWSSKLPRAYWKGNPDVASPVRTELLTCNHSIKWGAQIMRQDWDQEARDGFEQSKLSKQCNHRYKIYAEGFAWSVSLKYILSCGSMSLIISPLYQDFFSRGLDPLKNYWPIPFDNMCESIKHAVDWGNDHLSEAEAIGQQGQNFMESLSMDTVYAYMFQLITEYSKLLDFKPTPPPSALEVCSESLLCIADEKQRQFLEKSATSASLVPPCSLNRAGSDSVYSWLQQEETRKAM
ncbi:O-glucosyltransferase rumi homolog [Cucurbita maxima]|uniref:O-glucosyltransferase rumi homolog n=1 Tax=Cucurbita maxima TaxID=3661 RepID=A0A6J1HZ33_CUCMA|nr:O-glucosyltransferase rumi homolog [Cucurbita maxima]